MTDPNPLIALAEALKNTGTGIQSLGAKLHTFADALTTEVNTMTAENITLKRDLAAARKQVEALKNKYSRNNLFNVDVCVGVQANCGSSTFRQIGCCTGCEGAVDGGGSGGVVENAKSELSKALSEVASRASRAASQAAAQARSAEASSVVSRKIRSGGEGSHVGSVPGSQK